MLAGIDRLMIGEVLVHHLDVANWLAGPLAMVAARIRRDVEGIRGESAATMLHAGGEGRTAVVDGDMAVPGGPSRLEDRMEIVGDAGSIVLDGATLTLRAGAAPVVVHYDLGEAYQRSYDGAIAHFAHALLHGLPFETPAGAHLRVLALVEDAYRLAGR
jgi:predicted dehydrogenase